jgi:hypothetical protein
MRPEAGQPATLLVSFAEPEAKEPTRILATIPMIFDKISALPDLHRPFYSVSLAGRQPNGPYREIKMTFQDGTP